jgi:hypothetical protein
MPREGIYSLIQATICRRVLLGHVFQNPPHSAHIFLSNP